jgi:hypothetical protein
MGKSEITPIQYKVYITPRKALNTYATEIEVSANIITSSNMKKSIDASDFDIGVYYYGDVKLKVDNYDGKFSDKYDVRSLFPYGRDLAKVRISYNDKNGESTVFNGLIDDKATKIDFEKDEVHLTAPSNDSILRTLRVPAATITNGTDANTAFKNLLNRTEITTVLTYDESLINVKNNITIDDGSTFDNIPTRDAIAKLLVASNSCFIITPENKMKISSRVFNDKNATGLYGPFSKRGNQNILSLKKYNDGKQRQFTVVKIDDQVSVQTNYVADYGYRQKTVSNLDFITNNVTKLSVATSLSDEFKFPKIECEVEVQTSFAKTLNLLDPVKIDYPLRLVPDIKFSPIIGATTINDATKNLPYEYGGSKIQWQAAFKIIEIRENLKNFTSILKVRQTGKDIGDGYVDFTENSTVGVAIVGLSVVATGSATPGISPTVGAAVIDTSEIA